MNDYFLYTLVIASAILAYGWYDERKKHFATKVELDLIKTRSVLGGIGATLEENRTAYKAARDKFHAELHPTNPIPDYMLEHVSGGAATQGPIPGGNASLPPGFIKPSISADSDFDNGPQQASTDPRTMGRANGVRKPHQ